MFRVPNIPELLRDVAQLITDSLPEVQARRYEIT
jgi:hypothetical protein